MSCSKDRKGENNYYSSDATRLKQLRVFIESRSKAKFLECKKLRNYYTESFQMFTIIFIKKKKVKHRIHIIFNYFSTKVYM